MRRHAKASSNGPTRTSGHRARRLATASLTVLATLLLFANAQALAGTVNSHPLLSSIDGSTTPAGEFGPGQGPIGVAIDQSAGSVYVVAHKLGVIDKFDTAGNPQDFSALGTSALDVGASLPGGSLPEGEITTVAVDNSGGSTDGNIYVGGVQQVYVFDETGAYLYSAFTEGDFFPSGIAIDSAGNLYVSNSIIPPTIQKYQTSNSKATFVSQVQVPGPSAPLSLAIDSAANIYFPAGGGIQKYDPSGNLLSTIVPDEQFSGGVRGLAIDPSNDHLYVTYSPAPPDEAKVEEFDASGSLLSRFGQASIHGLGSGLAIDGTSGKVFVSNGGRQGSEHDVDIFGPLGPVTVPDITIDPPSNVSFFSTTLTGTVDPAGVPTTWRFDYRIAGEVEWRHITPDESIVSAGPVSFDWSGLDQNTPYQVRLVATNTATSVSTYSAVQSFTTLEVQPPTVASPSASQVSASSAHLSGVVNPHSFTTVSRFEYSSDGVTWSRVISSDSDVGSSNADVPVEADLTNLRPNTQYFIRVIARNSLDQETISSVQSFTTDPAAPTILASPAATIDTGTATLNARLLANGPNTTYHFEYGPDTGYGTTIPVPDGDAGSSGSQPLIVSEQIGDLSPNTTYHFRLVVSNAVGTTVGADRTFKTLDLDLSDGLPDGRVYEKVSPSFKNGVEVRNFSANGIGEFYYQAAPSGDAITWTAQGNFGEGGTPFATQYLSKRSASGWATEGLAPRMHPRPRVDLGSTFNWFSDDLSFAVFRTNNALLPGAAPDGGSLDLYLRDTAAPLDESNSAFQLLTQHLVPAEESSGLPRVLAASTDTRRVVLESPIALTADGGEGLYEWADGQINYLGGELGSGTRGGAAFPGYSAMSDDGSRIFHRLGSNLMVREGGTDRLVVSSPDAKFRAAEASSGSSAFFTDTAKHTTDATATLGNCSVVIGGQSGELGCPDLYRWDAEAPPGEELSDLTTADPNGGGVLGVAGLSKDATKLYFVALGRLAPGARDNAPNLYVWQEGEGVHYIATLSTELQEGRLVDKNVFGTELTGNVGHEGPGFGGARVTPDGEHLLFDSSAQITSYDNAGHKQLYLYDLASDEITCISCNTRTSHSTGDSYLSFMAEHGGFALNYFQARNLSADASRVFFDSTEALVPGDTNGKTDVYEWSDGRVHLITTGDSGRDSTFMGAGDNGNDVFFASQEPLVRSDGDHVYDLYDARVGGVPEPSPIPDCVGDECQGTPTPPLAFDDPGTSGFVGPGNPRSGTKKRCPKGKHKVVTRGKTRCVKQPASKHSTKKHR